MRGRRIGLIVLAAALLSACGAQGTAPSGAAAAKPSGSSAASNAEWDQVVAGAKREGKVVVVGQGGPPVQFLTDGFKQKFPDIQLDYTGASGAEIAAKLLTARAAGRYDVDAIVHGTTTIIADLIPAGAVDPLQP
ncbi:MAG TPA: hypothetical protein VKU60_04810, partial [Chloroflexota bacterium]|nr:hypothetical protein [Chloroflexota bacterium]